jgi:hypothetical protein
LADDSRVIVTSELVSTSRAACDTALGVETEISSAMASEGFSSGEMVSILVDIARNGSHTQRVASIRALWQMVKDSSPQVTESRQMDGQTVSIRGVLTGLRTGDARLQKALENDDGSDG